MADEVCSDENFLKKRIVFVDGDFDEKLCNKVTKQLLYLATTNSRKPVTMYISSNGGELFEFIKLYDVISGSPFKLNTVAVGKAQSAGALLLLVGDKRMSYPNTTIMLHELAYDRGFAKLHDQETFIEGSKKQQKVISDLVKRRTKIKNVEEYLKDENYHTPEEALKLGIIDEIKERI